MESTRVRPPYSTFGCISLDNLPTKHLAFSSQVSGGEVSLASMVYWILLVSFRFGSLV